MAGGEVADVEVAVRAAMVGAAIARGRYGTGARRVSDRGVDFSTEADIDTERAIRAVLAELRPGDEIAGEELGTSGDSHRCWLVDPICGTLNFASQVPLFAVNIALDIDGVTACAAVVDPIAGQVLATDGTTAWQRVDGRDSLLAPSAASRLVTVNLESAYAGDAGIRLLSDEAFRSRFSPRVLSTTLAVAWVATGQQAGYITGGDLRRSVHWTACIALCRAAGAVVTNLAGEQLHTGEHGMIAAADAETHALLLSMLDSVRREHAQR